MKKYAMLNCHDEEAGFYYDACGDRFIPFTEALMNSVTTDTPVVEYDDRRTMFVTVNEEVGEVQAECFIFTRVFNNIEEMVQSEYNWLKTREDFEETMTL